MFDLLGAAQMGMGLLGLGGASEAEREQARSIRASRKLTEARTRGVNAGLNIAERYDPARENQSAIDYATENAKFNLGNSLGELNRTYGAAAGNDSLFRVRAQGAVNRVADPLKQYAAELKRRETTDKLAALSQAVGNGSDLAGDYMSIADRQAPDYSGPAQLLSAGLSRFNLPQSKKGLNDSQKRNVVKGFGSMRWK